MIYIHIPFCRSFCTYCDFYSEIASRCCKDEQSRFDSFASALTAEIASYSGVSAGDVNTLYIGGGTPSVLPLSVFEQIVGALREHGFGGPYDEFTVEVNPATIDGAGLARLRQVANRVSIGVQSTDDGLLRRLGRLHNFAQAQETVLAAKNAGFANISCDLMFGLPDQTAAQLAASIDTLAALPITHLSLYALTVEPDTPFGRDPALVLPDEDVVADMYADSIARLADHGFAQYEISNFARDGLRSRHNLRYWDCAEYLGFGPAAYSYLNGVRFGMPRDIGAYLATGGKAAAVDALTVDREVLTEADKENEYVMLRLRLTDGIAASDFAARFGKDFLCAYGKKIDPYIASGPIERTADGCHLTPLGFAISNHILSDLLSF